MGKFKDKMNDFGGAVKRMWADKRARLIFIGCLATVLAVALTVMTVLLVKCNKKDGGASITVTVNGAAQTDGATYNAYTDTPYTVAYSASNGSAVTASYAFAGGAATPFEGKTFTPQSVGSYAFTFNAEKAKSFRLTFAVTEGLGTYPVIFDLGDRAAQDAVAPDAQRVAADGKVILPAAPAAAYGYEFVGWTDGSVIYGVGTSYSVTAAVTFTAVWQAQLHTVSYALGAHPAAGITAPAAQSIGYGTEINLPAPLAAAAGYVFTGWSDGAATCNGGSAYTVAKDVTFTAVWAEKGSAAAKCTVGFNLGKKGAAVNASAPAAKTVDAGDAVILPDAPAAAEYYTFTGWSDGSRTYAAGESYTVHGSVTLTAQWQAETFTVSYGLGDHAAAGATAPANKTVEAGTAITLPAAVAPAEGYIFRGWTDGGKTYLAGASYTVAGNVTLTAVWEKKSTAPAVNTIINGDFETGDLTGWTANGDGFAAVYGATETDWGNGVYNQEGDYHLDGWKGADGESGQGTLKSSVFELGGTGKISFRLGGGNKQDATYLSVKKEDDTEVARFTNTKQQPKDGAGRGEQYMWVYAFDLTTVTGVSLGDRLYIEIADFAASDWGLLFADDIKTYHTAESFAALGAQGTDWFNAVNCYVNEVVTGENVLTLGFEESDYTVLNKNGGGSVSTVNGVLNNPVFQDGNVLPYRPAGVEGKALSFDGYSQYLSYNGDVRGRALTVDVYVCPRAYAWSAPQDTPDKHAAQVIVGSYDSGAKRGFMLGITKFGYPTFRVGTGENWYILSFPANTSQYRLPTYEWSRLTAVFDGAAGKMYLYINGQIAQTLDIKKGSSIASSGREILVGAASEPAYEARFEITKFNGLMDELTVISELNSSAEVLAADKTRPVISYDAARLPDYALANDCYRPQYHAAPPANWMNEPHALFKYNGKWHLFYQYNPVGPYWRNICWGHWVSDDMVQWKYVKEAVIPTEGTVTPDGVWTGNVVFDENDRPLLLITAGDDSRPYNNSNQHVGLVRAKDYSDPYLTEWEIVGFAVRQTAEMGKAGEFRDAQAFGIGDDRYMVVGGSIDGKGAAHVFKTTANKLQDWQYMGSLYTPASYKPEYGDVWEMPNLVPLAYEDGTPSGKYLFVFSPQHGDNDVWYYIGAFNTATCRFTPDASFGNDAKLMDFGDNVFTGPTVYLENATGKVYISSIMQDQRDEEDRYNAGWAFMAGLPRELFLRQDGTLGVKHIDTSSAEGAKIVSFTGLNQSAANAQLNAVNSDLIKIDFTISDAVGEVGLKLKNGADGYAKLYFTDSRAGVSTNAVNNMYQRVKGDFSGEYARGATVTGTVYIDKALIEVYFDNAGTISNCCYGRGCGLQVFGDATFSITVTAMNTIH